MKRLMCAILGVGLGLLCGATTYAGDASAPAPEPVLEMPTLHSLGVYWIVKGDDNQNARIDFEYRKAGTQVWQKAPPLWRVEKGANKNAKGNTTIEVPEDAWLFAGSALMLNPETTYDLKLTLTDPDGGNTEKLLQQATIGEPVAPADLKQYHVIPGEGGGTGTAADPFKGLNAAQDAAAPGTLFLLHAGSYDGPFMINKCGEPGKPIVWRAAGDGDAFIDGKCPPDKREGAAIDLVGMHDVWFEGISVGNTYNCFKAHGAQRIVVRRTHMHDCVCGFFASVNAPRVMTGFFIADNLIEGACPWPSTAADWKKPPEARGIWVGGLGHVVCYNRVHNFKDGIDTAETMPCAAIDFHNNEISESVDDGTEMDGSERNTRCFLNRYTNTLTGLSFQPIYGGPSYAFRNVCYNFRTEAVKLHNSPSGVLLVHNTFVHLGPALWVHTNAIVHHTYSRDNLYIGTEGHAMDFSPKMENCDFDYDGFGAWSGNVFMKFNGVFATPEEAKAKSSQEKHLILLDAATLFASGILPPTRSPNYDPKNEEGYGTNNLNKYPVEKGDFRLKPGCAAINVGEVVPGYGDDPTAAPYLGAFAPGAELPQYGPRVVK